MLLSFFFFFFFFNDTATTEIYTLSLHDALPICAGIEAVCRGVLPRQLDFPYAMVDVPTDLREDPIDGVRSHPPPGDPRDAIGTTARASLGDRDDRVPPSE